MKKNTFSQHLPKTRFHSFHKLQIYTFVHYKIYTSFFRLSILRINKKKSSAICDAL